MQASDTQTAAGQFHLKLLREASFTHRLNLVFSLVKTTRALSWNGVCERHKDEGIASCVEHFAFLLYGDRELSKKLAQAYAARLKKADAAP